MVLTFGPFMCWQTNTLSIYSSLKIRAGDIAHYLRACIELAEDTGSLSSTLAIPASEIPTASSWPQWTPHVGHTPIETRTHTQI